MSDLPRKVPSDSEEHAGVLPVIPSEILAPSGHRALSLVETDRRPIALGGFAFDDFREMLGFAHSVANELRQVVRTAGLEVTIGGAKKPHIMASGWSTMLAMLGVVPVEVKSECDAAGVYTSYVDLRRIRDGALVGGASAECGNSDEKDRTGNPTWADRPAFARKSMSITRAMSKAARLSFAWIVELAGYAPRAAEEMPGFDPDAGGQEGAPPVKRYANQWEDSVIAFIVGSQFVQADDEIKAATKVRQILNLSPFLEVPFGQLEIVDAVAWVYGWLQTQGKHPTMEPKRRAKIVQGGWDDPVVKLQWQDWALAQIPPENPK